MFKGEIRITIDTETAADALEALDAAVNGIAALPLANKRVWATFLVDENGNEFDV